MWEWQTKLAKSIFLLKVQWRIVLMQECYSKATVWSWKQPSPGLASPYEVVKTGQKLACTSPYIQPSPPTRWQPCCEGWADSQEDPAAGRAPLCSLVLQVYPRIPPLGNQDRTGKDLSSNKSKKAASDVAVEVWPEMWFHLLCKVQSATFIISIFVSRSLSVAS